MRADIDFALSEPVTLSSEERQRFVMAIDALSPMIAGVDGVNEALRFELEAARVLAGKGSYHYDSMSALLAKQMMHLATLDLHEDVKAAAGEVIKAHLDVGLRS